MIVYFYGGNMGHAQDMMNIVRLAHNMRNHPDAHFVLVGAGDEVELIENKIIEDDIKNITLLPSVNQEEFKEMLSEFDIGLFTLNYNHQTHNFPGKLLGYMCESKAILGSVNPNNDLKDVIESANAGYISITGQDELLYENAVKLLDEKTRINMGENANNLLDRLFTVKSIAKQILSIK